MKHYGYRTHVTRLIRAASLTSSPPPSLSRSLSLSHPAYDGSWNAYTSLPGLKMKKKEMQAFSLFLSHTSCCTLREKTPRVATTQDGDRPLNANESHGRHVRAHDRKSEEGLVNKRLRDGVHEAYHDATRCLGFHAVVAVCNNRRKIGRMGLTRLRKHVRALF